MNACFGYERVMDAIDLFKLKNMVMRHQAVVRIDRDICGSNTARRWHVHACMGHRKAAPLAVGL